MLEAKENLGKEEVDIGDIRTSDIESEEADIFERKKNFEELL